MAIRAMIIDDEFEQNRILYERLFPAKEFEEQIQFFPVDLEPQAIARGARSAHLALVDIHLRSDLGPLLIDDNLNILDLLRTEAADLPVCLVSKYWDALSLSVNFDLIGRRNIVGSINLQENALAERECSRIRYDLIRKVSEHWRQAVLSLGSDEDLVVLHLSDLQVGGAWVGSPGGAAGGERLISDLFNALPVNDDGMIEKPHVLAITGDITEHGDPEEFEIALEFLERLTGRLDIEQNRRFVVPGNHDVTMALACSEVVEFVFGKTFSTVGKRSNPRIFGSGIRPDLRQYGLAPFREFTRRFSGRDDWRLGGSSGGKGLIDTFFSSDAIAAYGLRIVGINTVFFQGPKEPKAARLEESVPVKAEECVRAVEPSDRALTNLVLLHHSPWSDLGDSTLDEDGRELLQRLSRHGPCVFAFGHIHEAVANVRPFTPNSRDQALFIASPTPSLMGNLRPEDSLRGFHLLRFRRASDQVVGAIAERFEYSDGEYCPRPRREFVVARPGGWVGATGNDPTGIE